MRAQLNVSHHTQAHAMAEQEQVWTKGVVVSNRHHTQNLFSLRIEADMAPFQAGQYTSLALESDGQRIAQPYSLLSAPGESPLEFFFYTQLDGQLSAKLSRLQSGDNVWVQAQAEGAFTLNQVPPGRDLWLLATGTGVAPFLSMLKDGALWQRFDHVVLVYAVRQWQDVVHGELIAQMQARYPDRFSFVPFVSRETVAGCVHGHIPACISNGTLERVAARSLSLAHSQLMLCGNPGMVQDALSALEQRGFVRSEAGRTGHVTLEAYW